MQIEFQPGDIVANKANPKIPYTYLQRQNDEINAVIMDGSNQKIIIPLVVLIKFETPEQPGITDISNLW